MKTNKIKTMGSIALWGGLTIINSFAVYISLRVLILLIKCYRNGKF